MIAAFADGCAREGAILAIAGSGLDGSYGQGCLSLAEELGVSGSIEWLGSMTPAQLAAEMARSQVLALPSGAESAPMVIAEALAQGLPVVAAVALLVAGGQVAGEALIAATISMPMLLAGWVVGNRVFHRLDPVRFRLIVLVMLVITAAVALMQAAFNL